MSIAKKKKTIRLIIIIDITKLKAKTFGVYSAVLMRFIVMNNMRRWNSTSNIRIGRNQRVYIGRDKKYF